MRTCCFFCSLLVLVLSFVPNAPAQESTPSWNVVHEHQKQLQHEDEICSPFFPCAGCVAPIITKLFKFKYLIQSLGVFTFNVLGENKPIQTIHGIWQPPQ